MPKKKPSKAVKPAAATKVVEAVDLLLQKPSLPDTVKVV
jgi:hypothetical protein